MLARGASDADVGLRANGPSLTDIYADGVFQQIVNTLYWRRLYFVAAQYSDHSRCLPQSKRCARAGDLYVVEGRFLVGLGNVVGNGIANRCFAIIVGGGCC